MNYEHDIKTLLTIGENIVIEFKRAGNGPEHDTYESIEKMGRETTEKATLQTTLSIGERSDIGFSSLYGTREKAYFPRRLAGLVEIAQIRLLDQLIVTPTRETSKSYCSIREIYQELFNMGTENEP